MIAVNVRGLGFVTRVRREHRRWIYLAKLKIRHVAARLIYSLPLLSHRDPRRKQISFLKHCRPVPSFPTPDVDYDWRLAIDTPERFKRKPSIAVDARQEAMFKANTDRLQHGNDYEAPPVYLACVHDALVYRDFLVLSRDNHILLESALCNGDVLEANGILDYLTKPRQKRIDGDFCLLSHPWSRGYYHWVMESLTRLSVIERFAATRSLPLIVSHEFSSFQRESLELAGIPMDRVVKFPSSEGWRVDRLYFPELLSPTGNPSARGVAWLRNRFLGPANHVEGGRKRRLYLSRRDALRRVLNEEEITRYLTGLGFEIVCCGDCGFAEQIELFRNVELVVAPHGAAVTNMVFAPEGAAIIELFGDNYINGCYWALANICRQEHAFLIGPSTALNYEVSLPGLKSLVERFLRAK